MGEEEVEAIRNVLASGTLTNGPRTKEFEQTYAEKHGVEHAVAFANGTVALAAMYLGLGLGPGDEVIVPSLSFISSATSIVHVGATPVFADVDPRTFNISVDDARRKVTPRTKAILAVHYGGQAADLDELNEVARSADAWLLEDAAQAHGSTYRGAPVGSIGKAAMFSFTPTKNITTGEGGIVTTRDGELADRMRLLRNHGQERLYEHVALGYNWRLTEMQAAMGLCQLAKLDSILERKRANAEWMADRLAGVDTITPPTVLEDREHVYMLYTLTFADSAGRDRAMANLNRQGIEARIYFPPIHLQPVFAGTGVALPETEALFDRILSVPFHARLGIDELEEIAAALLLKTGASGTMP